MSTSAEAELLFNNHRLLDAARILRTIKNNFLTDQQRKMLRTGEECQAFVESATKQGTRAGAVDDGDKWTRLGERSVRGNLADVSYVLKRYNSRHYKIRMRIDALLHRSLLSPLFAVLNESDSYASWMPSWSVPRLCLEEAECLRRVGRASQRVRIRVRLPWPLDARELLLAGTACDDVETSGVVAVKIDSLSEDDEDWFPPEKGVHRVEFHGGFVFRRPPPETVRRAKEGEYVADDARDLDHVASSYAFEFENRGSYSPDSLVLFVFRVATVVAFSNMLKVAEEIRDGKRADFAAAIAEKRDVLYDWIDNRVEIMCAP